MSRNIQSRIAHEILRIMREDNGKPWMDSPGNVRAIFDWIYSSKELPIFMRHMGAEMQRLYKDVVTEEYITELNKVVKTVPQDIRDGASVFKTFFCDLTDISQGDAREWITDLKEAIRRWKEEDGPEPDWNSFREEANEFCQEDGMPNLFEVQ